MDVQGSFVYSSTSPRVLFGRGTLDQLPGELGRLGASKPLLICSPSRVSLADSVQETLYKADIVDVQLLDTAIVHNPSHVIEAALDRVAGRDCLISLGGGSAVGLGKALALRVEGIPHIAIPTTYSGSEMTPIIGETKDGNKTSTTHPRVLPAVVIYDVDLTLDLPMEVTGPSGMNALAHSIEALYAENTNPVSALLAIESIKSLVPGLLALARHPNTPAVEARTSVLYGAFLAGMVVASTGIALQHKLAHAAGGTLNLPHAETHAILLPHTIAYNAAALGDDILEKLATALSGGPDGEVQQQQQEQQQQQVITEADKRVFTISGIIRQLNALNRELGVPKGLREIGMKETDVDRVVDVAFEKPYWNPRELDKGKIRELVRRAWAGEEARFIP